MSNFSGAEFVARQPKFVLPVQQHVADLLLGEGDGRAARAGVEHRHVVVEEFRDLRLDLGVLIDREVLGGGGGGGGFGLALGRGEIMRLGIGQRAPQRQDRPSARRRWSWDWR